MPFINSKTFSGGEGSSTLDFFNVSTDKPSGLESPVGRLRSDVFTLVLNFKRLSSVLRPFWTHHETDELYLFSPGSLQLFYFAIVSVLETLFILSALLLTFCVSMIVEIIARLDSFIFWRPVQGPDFQVSPRQLPSDGTYNPRHRWVYINGIATTSSTMAQELEFLSTIFSTPVLGLNNRTYGFLGDLLECVVQRSFNYHTRETRFATKVIKSFLLTRRHDTQDSHGIIPRVGSSPIDKVILIAHSQGGILASHIVDALLLDSDICPSDLARLEIYTFGSAATTMNNPYRDASRATRLIPVMEHYCNEFDMVTRWGALSDVQKGGRGASSKIQLNKTSVGNSPFKGKVFIRKNQTGHLLNQHYLRPMFTDDEEITAATTKPMVSAYLDRPVRRIDVNHDHLRLQPQPRPQATNSSLISSTTSKTTSHEKDMYSLRNGSATETETDPITERIADDDNNNDDNGDGDARYEVLDDPHSTSSFSSRSSSDQGHGLVHCKNKNKKVKMKTVRDVSGLWRYMRIH